MTDLTTESGALLTPAQMVERTGVSLDTLRYYEREGLLGDVPRATNGHRRYRSDDVFWIEVLRCLRETGMPIADLRRYCALGERGDTTEPERYEMLASHRRLVEDQISELTRAVALIDHKMAHYPQHGHDRGDEAHGGVR